MRMRSTYKNVFRRNSFDQISRAVTQGGRPSEIINTYYSNFSFSFFKYNGTDEEVAFLFNCFFWLSNATRYRQQGFWRDDPHSSACFQHLCMRIMYPQREAAEDA